MIVTENQFFEYLSKQNIYNKWRHISVTRIKALGWLNNPTLNLVDIFSTIRNYYLDDIAGINSLRYFCDYFVGYNFKASEKKFLGKHYYWGILENSNDELDYLSICNRFVCLMDKYFDYIWENSTYQVKKTSMEIKECLCDLETYYEDICLPAVDRHFTPSTEYVVFLEQSNLEANDDYDDVSFSNFNNQSSMRKLVIKEYFPDNGHVLFPHERVKNQVKEKKEFEKIEAEKKKKNDEYARLLEYQQKQVESERIRKENRIKEEEIKRQEQEKRKLDAIILRERQNREKARLKAEKDKRQEELRIKREQRAKTEELLRPLKEQRRYELQKKREEKRLREERRNISIKANNEAQSRWESQDTNVAQRIKKEYEEANLVEIESSWIAAIGYNCDSKKLYIKYKTNELYFYCDVDKGVFDAFLNSQSKGSFFYHNIQNKYIYVKVHSFTEDK